MLSTVTTKGQVTIPAVIRSRFNIMPNDRIDFMVDGERIIISAVKTLKQLRGAVSQLDASGIATERQQAKKVLADKISGELP